MRFKFYEINLKNTNKEELTEAMKELYEYCNKNKKEVFLKMESPLADTPSFREIDIYPNSDFGFTLNEVEAVPYIMKYGYQTTTIDELVNFIMEEIKDY